MAILFTFGIEPPEDPDQLGCFDTDIVELACAFPAFLSHPSEGFHRTLEHLLDCVSKSFDVTGRYKPSAHPMLHQLGNSRNPRTDYWPTKSQRLLDYHRQSFR
jgi:hypothetical protein